MLAPLLLFSRHLLGCLEEALHWFDVWSKLLAHLPILFNIKASNWEWKRYYTNKNRCYTWSQPKGTAVEAGCWAQVSGTHLVQLFLWYLVIQQWPDGWGRNYNGHLLFQGAGWPALANAEVRGRAGETERACLHFIVEIFFLQDLGTSVKFIQDSYVNHLDCFEDFKPTSISKSFSF